jgi:hypothetical protein
MARLVAEHVIGLVCRKLAWQPPPVAARHRERRGDGPELDLGSSGADLPTQVRNAVREEMAYFLADVLFRRTQPPAALAADPELVRNCADLMSDELGWSTSERIRQLSLFEDAVARRQPWRPAPILTPADTMPDRTACSNAGALPGSI